MSARIYATCSALLAIAFSHAAPSCIYLGSTDTGWQVFHFDFERQDTKQLTFSPGDKRAPFVFKENVYYRDANGLLHTLKDGVEVRVDYQWPEAASFSLDSKDCAYIARLATGNPQRQFAWKLEPGSAKAELIFRPRKGSLRQVVVSPDGLYLLASHIIEMDDERILWIPLDNLAQSRYITPVRKIAAFPAWSADAKAAYFSLKVADGNYDIWKVDLESANIHAVLETSDASEFSVAAHPNQQKLIYEKRSNSGSMVEILDLNTSRVETLHLPHAAKEPVWWN